MELYRDMEYKLVEFEFGMRRDEVETLLVLMKLVLRRNAGCMIKAGWRRGIMWVREDGCAEPWLWSSDDVIGKFWKLRVGLLSGLLRRLMWRVLCAGERFIVRDDFVVELPPEIKENDDE